MDLARALAEQSPAAQLTVLTGGAHDISGEDPTSPLAALANGAVASLRHELGGGARALDLHAADDPAETAEAVVAELGHRDAAVALRRGIAWLPNAEPMAAGGGEGPVIRADGVYVLTGGLGGIALELAKEIVERGGRKLALLSRDVGPWKVAAVAADLEGLRAEGATVELFEVDVSDRERLSACLGQVRRELGVVAGVVHAAGNADGGLAATHRRERAEAVLAPKVAPANFLVEYLRDSPGVDFLVLCSSIDAVLGEPGAADYAAANAYMDALARRSWQRGERRVVSIGWDAWREVGMAARRGREGIGADPSFGLTNQEGRELFARALVAGVPYAVVSTAPLAERLAAAAPGPRPAPEPAVVAATPEVPVVAPPEIAAGAPEVSLVAPEAPGVEPDGDDLPAAATAIWAELLGRPDLSPEEDVFRLGGHSLMATQVATRLRQTLGHEIPVRAVIEARTGAELAAALHSGSGDLAEPQVEASEEERRGPLSPLQQRIWVLHLLNPRTLEFTIPFAMRIRGELDAGALQRAAARLVARHESLRTVFYGTEAGPVQEVRPADEFALETADVPPCSSEQAIVNAATEFALQPFDLERGPVFRCRLLRLGAGDHMLVVSAHHLVFDGWSLSIFHRELAALYGAEIDGGPNDLAPLSRSHLEVVRSQLEATDTPGFRDSLAQWRRLLEGVPALDLSTERRRPAVRSGRGATVDFDLDLELLRRVDALAADRGGDAVYGATRRDRRRARPLRRAG